MAKKTSRSAAMTLYSRPECPYAHAIRLVLAEKGVPDYDVVEIRPDTINEDLLALNPENTVPTFVDRDVVLGEPRTIIEYLDERYPHPPLMPVEPAERARYRQVLHRLERDLFEPAEALAISSPTQVRKLRKQLRENVAMLAGYFDGRSYMGDGFSLLDCALAPILWRLDHYRIELPEATDRTLSDYSQRLFQRPSFRHCLTAAEADMAQN